jgi:hypothetical protein
MSDNHGEFTPLPVHVLSMPATPPRRKVRTTFRTVIVNGANATVAGKSGSPGIASTELLPASDLRDCAYVQALDDDIIVSTNESDARAGTGTLIPQSNTAPWPIHTTEAVYVAVRQMAGPMSRVSVTVDYSSGP